MEQAGQKKINLLGDKKIVSRAVLDSFAKLHPRTMVKNPVMFVVEVGAVLTSIELVKDTMQHAGQFGFGLQITLWLWFTVLFANFAEAMAEGRGKAQAETLRKARAETVAHRLRADGSLVCGTDTGSLHKLGATLQGAPSCNGWTFWHYEAADGRLKAVDDLRQTYLLATVV